MGHKITSSNLAPGAVLPEHLSQAAVQSVLSTRYKAALRSVAGVSASGGSIDVTAAVNAVATDVTRRTNLTSGTGVYVGPVSGPSDRLRVTLRRAGTDNGVDDGSGDDAWGKLVQDVDTTLLVFYDASNNPLSFLTPVSVDFSFVEVFTDLTLPEDAQLVVGGASGAMDKSAHDLAVSAGAAALAAQGTANQGVEDAATAQDTADTALFNITALLNQLKVVALPSSPKRVGINAAVQALQDSTLLIQELNQLPLSFTGAQVDFITGTVYKEDGVTELGLAFTPPTVAEGKYRWATITLVPKEVNVQNEMVGQVLVMLGSTDGDTADEAPRSPFAVGKPLAQVLLRGAAGGGIEDIVQANIQRLTAGSGAGGSTQVLREVPTGDIDGVNDTFTLAYEPMDAVHVLVFLDGIYVLGSKWSIANGDEIVFQPGSIPQLGQDIEVIYAPDPISFIGGQTQGGSTFDPLSVTVDMRPDTNGARSLGADTKGFKDLKLKDTATNDVYRVEITNGVLQAVLVE